jgi:hypothetical protein
VPREGTKCATARQKKTFRLMPSSSALIPMSIRTLQCLFSHSFTTYEWLNRNCDVQIDIGIWADELGIKWLKDINNKNNNSSRVKITNESKVGQIFFYFFWGGGRSARQCIRLFQKSDPNPQSWTSHFKASFQQILSLDSEFLWKAGSTPTLVYCALYKFWYKAYTFICLFGMT